MLGLFPGFLGTTHLTLPFVWRCAALFPRTSNFFKMAHYFNLPNLLLLLPPIPHHLGWSWTCFRGSWGPETRHSHLFGAAQPCSREQACLCLLSFNLIYPLTPFYLLILYPILGFPMGFLRPLRTLEGLVQYQSVCRTGEGGEMG